MHRIRSLLFVPGDSERKIHKALECSADALILDLEDAVTPDRKPAAREICRAATKAPGLQQLDPTSALVGPL